MPLAPPQHDPDAWETVVDSVEQSFTIALPRGWAHRAWLQRVGVGVTQLATATAPDGSAALFSGDPSFPMFTEPGAAPFGAPPGSVLRPYTSIEYLLPEYVQRRFGNLAGFRITGMAPSPDLFQVVLGQAQRSGAPQVWITAGRLAFEFDEGSRRVRALVFGSATSFGAVWMVEVHGITSLGDPEALAPALLGLLATRQVTPQMHRRQMDERMRSAAAHQAAMAQLDANAAILRSNHHANMDRLASMAASHQAHMQSLHAAHDAQAAAWHDRQAAADAAHAAAMQPDDTGHRRFLNAIAEERTVVDAEGHTHQVPAGFDRYFRRRGETTFIGTRGDRDLRGLPGVNPDDYEEVRIRV